MNEIAVRLVIFSGITVVCAWVGGVIPLQFEWRRDRLWLVISFGAGVLLGAAFLHMLPEAWELAGASASSLVLAGFLTLYFIEKYIMVHACGAEECGHHTTGLAAFVGLSVHALLEGIAIASSAAVPGLGPVVLLAIISHKLPASLSLAALLMAGGYRKGHIMALVTLFSLMVPVGAVIAYLIIGAVSRDVLGWLLAFAAGTFIHIAASDLLPELHRTQHDEYRTWSLATFIGGVVVMWGALEIAG